MPTPRVKDNERRRCAQACLTCKRRKERCDGHQPCRRCSARGQSSQCSFTFQPGTPWAQRRRQGKRRQQSAGSGSPVSLHANGTAATSPDAESGPPQPSATAAGASASSPPNQPKHTSALLPRQSRLILDGRGKFMYIGDSANLSFLQVIRRIVQDSLGPCAFTSDPSRHFIVEETPADSGPGWMWQMAQQPPPKPRVADAEYLLYWYRRATSAVLDLFDESELGRPLIQWLQAPDASIGHSTTDPVFFLILAIGAQSCPDDKDALAEQYFNFGRLLSVAAVMEDPSISTVHSNVLITLYLLAAARRNAAFMYLGLAVRAAYALGIHRSDINSVFAPPEYAERERAWRVLRVLDMFMSSSQGRPPSTSETRDTTDELSYSALNDLCSIYEATLLEVYVKREVSTDTLERLSERHRMWSARFVDSKGLGSIPGTEFVQVEDRRETNLALCFLKQSYYGSIMLLARPSLVEAVTGRVSQMQATIENTSREKAGGMNLSSPSTDEVMVNACVDSAVHTVELLQGLVKGSNVPKRLPFLINSLFISSLVLGFAYFGDLDDKFPLNRSLEDAQRLLSLFTEHDAVARRHLTITKKLCEACQAYVKERMRWRMEQQSLLVFDLFGTLQPGPRCPSPSASQAAETATATAGQDQQTLAAPDTGFASMANTTPDDLFAYDNLTRFASPRAFMFGSPDQDVPLFYATGESEIGGLGLW